MKLAGATALHVLLDFSPGNVVPVGRLALDRGRAVLEYDPDFIASNLRLNPRFAPPRPELVWAAEPRFFDGLHGVFADSLPDAWGRELMRRRAIATGLDPNSLTAIDRLAAVGRHGMGALVYEPARRLGEVDEVDLDALSREAFDLLAGDVTGDLSILEALGESSGGARPKILIAKNAAGHLRSGIGTIPAGYDAWIVKFRAPRDRPDSGPLEAAYADMARAARIDIAPTTLLASGTGGPGYFATRRFDRGPAGKRFHTLSLAGMLEMQWEIPSIDYHGLLSAVRYVTRRQPDVEQMFRRMVFNVAAHNRDDHAKQHAFLMDESGTWRLAPAYDLNFSAGPAGEHYLTVEGRGTDITGEQIRALATRQNLGAATTSAIVDQVTTAVANFDRFAAAYSVATSSRKEIATILDRHARELRVTPLAKRPSRTR